MNTLSQSELVEALDEAGGHVVSIYLPAQAGADSRQNSVRLKNLLRDAENKLAARQADRSDVSALLAPAWELVERDDLSGQLAPGMALLIGPAGLRMWRLPFECDERCVVGRNFYVLPLVLWLNNDAPYYVLSVSQNQVRLLRGTRAQIEAVDVPDLPANRPDALDPQSTQQAHVSRPQVAGKGDLMFHGHGGAPDAAPAELESFLRDVDRAVAKFLRLANEPLVFAGVDYLFPMYQQVNNYAHLLPTPITGNPELWSDAEIREKAWPLVDEARQADRNVTLEKYGNLIAHGRATNQLEDIIVAAHAGAVETLFVDPNAQRPGRFSPENLTVEISDAADAEAEDLVNLAATLVLAASGNVETPAAGNVPGGGAMAAVLRYEFSPVSSQQKTSTLPT